METDVTMILDMVATLILKKLMMDPVKEEVVKSSSFILRLSRIKSRYKNILLI